jgi:hypothetical protein
MTQRATPESVLGNFENATLELLGKTYHLERRGDEFWVELEDPDWEYDPRSKGQSALLVTPPRVKKRIGLLTGSHHMQAYWLPSRFGNIQLIFPFAWLIEDQRWAPFHQTFLRDPALPPSKHVWNSNCIGCHRRPAGRESEHASAGHPLGRIEHRLRSVPRPGRGARARQPRAATPLPVPRRATGGPDHRQPEAAGFESFGAGLRAMSWDQMDSG